MTVLLLDAYNLLYRAFTSLPPAIVGKDGRPMHAVYGLTATLLRLVRDLEATHVVAAFDAPQTPTFRHALYPDYQGHRGPLGGDASAEFLRQVEMALQALPRVGVPALTYPGYEADDIMGTLARQVAQAGGTAIIVSTDRDLLQTIGPGIEILVPGAKPLRIRDAEAVRTRMGVLPQAVPTFKALAGDPSDNIPGVRGIGAKTAAALVDAHGTLEEIFANLETLPPRTRSALVEGREMAFLFRTVATVVTDLPLPLSPSTLPRPVFSSDARVRDVLSDMGYPRP